MARKTPRKTTKKKTAGTKKTTRSGSSARSKVTKKKTTKVSPKKKTAAAAKKKTTKKKTTAKKTTTKKTTTKKTTAKKTTAKKTTAKKTTTKKTTAKKTTASTKKTAKPSPKKAPADKTKQTPAAEGVAKTTANSKKKKKKKGRGRSLGARSVAEAASAGEADAQGYVYINGRRVRMISTGGQTPIKKSRTKAAAAELEPEVAAKIAKTKLTARELRHYRDILLTKRAELVGDVSAMEKAALQARGGNLSNLPLHMADIGTDTYDQDFMLSLAETERKRLREIDDALHRIENKTYGVCQMTGKPIPAERLKAKPWAKYTIEAARELERQWGT